MIEALLALPWGDILKILGGLLTGGAGLKWYQTLFENKVTVEEIKADFRDELRQQIDRLNSRINILEKENEEWRSKFFDQQEKYFELKRENQDLRHAVENLQDQISVLNNE